MPQRLLGRLARDDASRLACEDEAELRVAIELGVGARDELVRLRLPRLLARLRPLRERIDRHGTHHREQDGAHDDDREQLPMSSVGCLLLPFELPLGLVTRAPGDHGLREDVVEDLVADGAALVE